MLLCQRNVLVAADVVGVCIRCSGQVGGEKVVALGEKRGDAILRGILPEVSDDRLVELRELVAEVQWRMHPHLMFVMADFGIREP